MKLTENIPTKLIVRIAVLSLVAVIIQETVISKISIFGVAVQDEPPDPHSKSLSDADRTRMPNLVTS